MNSIQQAVLDIIPGKHKQAHEWVSFNAPCCPHNGETVDKKGRGGITLTPDGGFVYHCFNCGFKTGWMPGLNLSFKNKRWFGWMGMDESQIQLLAFEALRNVDVDLVRREKEKVEVNFVPRELPEGKYVRDWLQEDVPEDLIDCIAYLDSRGFSINDADWYWSPETNRRIILPFTWKGKVIGYTGRSIDPLNKTKYLSHYDPNYLYGLDNQPWDRKLVLVVEGVFDALAVDGVAILTNEVNEAKAEMIDTLGREVIAIPDQDKAGGKLIDAAIKYGWSVSFPEWEDDIKDCADSCLRYGKLYTLRTVLANKHSSKLKIELLRKRRGN